MKRKVLFLCPHGAAKSVMAAAFFNRRARKLDLPYRADAAGTEPDSTVLTVVVTMLQEEGLDVSGHVPRRVTQRDLIEADYVVSMGCTPEALDVDPALVQLWEDIPMVSQQPTLARDVIRTHVAAMVAALTAGASLSS